MIFVLSSMFIKSLVAVDYRHPLATWVAIISLACGAACILIIPLDVLSTTTPIEITVPFSGSLSESGLIRHTYYGFFSTLAILAFFIVPFSYFYVEDDEEPDFGDDDDDFIVSRHNKSNKGSLWERKKTPKFLVAWEQENNQKEKTSQCRRICSAMKYASIFICIFFAIFVVGMFLQTKTRHDVATWMDSLFNVHDKRIDASVLGADVERILLVVIGCLTIVGMMNFLFYTGYGLFGLPLQLLRAPRALDLEKDHVENEQRTIKIRKLKIKQKYGGNWKLMNRKHFQELARLDREEKFLAFQKQGINAMSKKWSYKCGRAFLPFRFLLGVLLLTLSLLITVSLTISSVDRQLNSFCGMECGYMLDSPNIFNPLDRSLMNLSQFFPLDYFFLAILCFYFFVVSLYGIYRLGIRFLGIQLFEIRHKGTWPQAILLVSWSVMLIILALMVVLTHLAPVYLMFGSQSQIVDGVQDECTVKSALAASSSKISGTPQTACAMTQISVILSYLTVSMPFFSLVFYFFNWILIVWSVVLFVWHFFQKKNSSYYADSGEKHELRELMSHHDDDDDIYA